VKNSIADVIYGGTPAAPQQRWLLGALFAIAAHVGVLIAALESQPTLEFWAGDLATRIHKELSRLHEAPLEPEAPPKPETPPPPPPQAPPPPPSAKAAPTPAPPAFPAAEPAAAAEVIAADATADFTGATIVTGSANVYAGGVTSSSGKSTTAVPLGTRTDPDAPSRATPVEPVSGDWVCPWPKEAERADVNEESATVRVVVDAEGVPQSVRIVRDPGFGFGAAAAACAMRETYAAARDASGKPTRAESAPIRVTFSR
jgi:protein TonB